MFIFTHLVAGILIGVVLFLLLRDLLVIVACAVGSILPDLIDKPLGLLISDGFIGYTRIYAHALVFFLAILVAGVILVVKYRSWILLAGGIGVLTHQALDSMWREYWNWLWPAYGPFRGEIFNEDYYSWLFAELTNPWEWLFGLALAGLIGALIWWGTRSRSGAG